MATKAFSPLRTGVDPRSDKRKGAAGDSGASSFVKFRDGDSKDLVILVEAEEIIAVEQCAIWLEDGNSPVWVYTGPEDPSHDLSVDRTYRAFLPVVELEDGKLSEPKVWGISKTQHIALLDVADASGELKGMTLRVKRTGKALATRYSIVPTGKRRDVSRIEEMDIIPFLGPITPEDAREHIVNTLGLADYDAVLEVYAGKRKAKASRSTRMATAEEEAEEEAKPKAKSKSKAVEEDELEELEDLELK